MKSWAQNTINEPQTFNSTTLFEHNIWQYIYDNIMNVNILHKHLFVLFDIDTPLLTSPLLCWSILSSTSSHCFILVRGAVDLDPITRYYALILWQWHCNSVTVTWQKHLRMCIAGKSVSSTAATRFLCQSCQCPESFYFPCTICADHDAILDHCWVSDH